MHSYLLGSVGPFRDASKWRTEFSRLETFDGIWPIPNTVSPRALSAAGFYYPGFGDSVKCAFCHNTLSNWEHGDIPMEEHRLQYPNCPFIKQPLQSRNVPLIQESPAQNHEFSMSMASDPDSTHRTMTDYRLSVKDVALIGGAHKICSSTAAPQASMRVCSAPSAVACCATGSMTTVLWTSSGCTFTSQLVKGIQCNNVPISRTALATAQACQGSSQQLQAPASIAALSSQELQLTLSIKQVMALGYKREFIHEVVDSMLCNPCESKPIPTSLELLEAIFEAEDYQGLGMGTVVAPPVASRGSM